MRFITLLLILCCSAVWAGEPGSLCNKDEQVIFTCSTGKKFASLCASSQFSKNSGYVQYRYGRPQKIELLYPETLKPSQRNFTLSNTGFSGGGASYIRFQNNGYEYFLYDSTVRTNFKAGEPNYPQFDAGIVVRQNSKKISTKHCKDNEASIRSPAYDQLERSDFDYDVLP